MRVRAGGRRGERADTADALKDGLIACKAEITGVCGKIVPGQGRIAACLLENKSTASSGCAEAIKKIEAMAAELRSRWSRYLIPLVSPASPGPDDCTINRVTGALRRDWLDSNIPGNSTNSTVVMLGVQAAALGSLSNRSSGKGWFLTYCEFFPAPGHQKLLR